MPINKSSSFSASFKSPVELNIELIILVTTPSLVTLAGGDIHIGISNDSVAKSMVSSVPCGTDRDE